jgi:hypothetical protein
MTAGAEIGSRLDTRVGCLALYLTTAPSRSRLRINVGEPRASASGMRDTTLRRLSHTAEERL